MSTQQAGHPDSETEVEPAAKKAILANEAPAAKSASPAKSSGLVTAAAPAKKSALAFVDLTGLRRVNVELFKGQNLVNIREYYEKNGAILPGKKGISLKPAQFTTLVAHYERLLLDLSSGQDSAVQFELGENRRAYVAAFKGTVLCHIREFYEDKSSGDMKPGQKGISLSAPQFQLLAGATTTLFVTEHLK